MFAINQVTAHLKPHIHLTVIGLVSENIQIYPSQEKGEFARVYKNFQRISLITITVVYRDTWDLEAPKKVADL